jgi:predicted transcriptional regulator
MSEKSTSTERDRTAVEERQDVDVADRDYSIYQCQTCDNVVLSMQECGDNLACHDTPMEPVTDVDLAVRPPEIRQVLLDAFGLPKAGLDVCLCVIGEGPLSPAELADRLDYEEGTVRKYLNELVEFGLLQRSQLNREQGGYVNVYHSIDIDEMREETLVAFYAWAGEAASLIEEANLTKAEYEAANDSERLDQIFWEQFEND